jgi:HPt (histidine-containing phosphotransfer) domain-containing protein
MDAYVSKPIQAQELLELIARIAAELPAPPPAPPPAPVVLDRKTALTHVGGDARLLAELVDVFLASSPALMADLHQAVSNRDAAAVRRLAHTIKGAVSGFGAAPAQEAALRLEVMGKSGDLAEVERAWAELEAAIERLKPALVELKGM